MLTLMREMSVICVSVLSNLTSSFSKTPVAAHRPFFQPCFCMKKKDSFGCRSEPSDKKCKIFIR